MGEEKEKKTTPGWLIFLYMAPLYVLLAYPIAKWVRHVNSDDVNMSDKQKSAFSSDKAVTGPDLKKDYQPMLLPPPSKDELPSGAQGGTSGIMVAGGSDITGVAGGGNGAGASDGGANGSGQGSSGKAGVGSGKDSKDGKAGSGDGSGGDRPNMKVDMAEAKKGQMLGAERGALTSLVGKFMSSPKVVKALFNNKYVVQAFLNRSTVKPLLDDPGKMKDFLLNSSKVNEFLNNGVVKAALKNSDVINALSDSAMINSLLESNAAKSLIKDPKFASELIEKNPQLAQVMLNKDIMMALMSNDRTSQVANQIMISNTKQRG